MTQAVRSPYSLNALRIGLDVVERQIQRVLRDVFGNARRIRDTEREKTGAGFDQQRIGVPVIAAGKLDHDVAPGEAAGETYRRHRRFGAGVDHAHLLDARHHRFDFLRHRHLDLGRRAERQRMLSLFGDGGAYLRMSVTENHRSPRADVVDVAVAIDVDELSTACRLEEQRRSTDASKSAHGRIDAAGNARFGAANQFVRLGVSRSHVVSQKGLTTTSATMPPRSNSGGASLNQRKKRSLFWFWSRANARMSRPQ